MNLLRIVPVLSVVFILVFSCSKIGFPEYPQGQIPNWTVNTPSGQAYNMYNTLAQGNAVVLDFSAMWCAPCQLAAPQVDSVFTTFGSGKNKVKVFEFLFQDQAGNPTDATDLKNWETSFNMSMPGFFDCEGIYSDYVNVYGNGIPTILVFVPNTDPKDPGNSTLMYDYVNGLGVTGGINTIHSDIEAVLHANGF